MVLAHGFESRLHLEKLDGDGKMDHLMIEMVMKK